MPDILNNLALRAASILQMRLNLSLPALVVDDFRTMASITARVLNGMGISSVDTVQTGEEALEMVRKKRYGVVFCDLHMKPMNGMELLRRMKANTVTASIPFIFLSGDPLDSKALSAKQAGASAFVLKPPSPGELRERLEEALRQAAQE